MLEPILHIVSTELDQLVRQSLMEKVIEPQYEEYFHWEFDSFEYTQDGPRPDRGHSVQFAKPNWFRSFQHFRQLLTNLHYFISLENKIAELYPNVLEPREAALQICSWFINVYLTLPTGDWVESISDIRRRVQRDLSMGPLNCNISIALTGITIESDNIELREHLNLRQCRQADLEKSISINNRVTGITRPFANNPTVFLEYSFIATVQQFDPSAMALLVDKFIAVLRLCGIGSVESFGYAVTTDALVLLPMAGEITNGNTKEKHNRYYISKELEEGFSKTFTMLEGKMPEQIYKKKNYPTEIGVAYSRYCDSLIMDDYFDKRVASIAMGLEALLSDSKTEIGFKLMQRSALLSEIIGKESLLIKELVKMAYSIRSNFAHGAILKENDRQKYLKTFESEKSFITAFSDLLRIFIIAFVLHDMNKKKLILDLDRAMIDLEHHRKLKESFHPTVQ